MTVWKGDALGELLPLFPQLKFTGRIAFILANLKHGDDHDLHVKRSGAGLTGLAVTERTWVRCGARDRLGCSVEGLAYATVKEDDKT